VTVAVVGLGLIGTSVALALKRADADATLIGIDRADVIRHPRIVELFTIASTELEIVADADVVILATPVGAILGMLPAVAKLAPKATIMDTGSTKRAILAAAREAGLSHFVGGHPLAGLERSGPDAARADLFDARPWFLIGAGAPLTAMAAFVQRLGATAVFMSDDGSQHDRLMGAVSHLPQVVATALMARVGEVVGRDGLAHAGNGLRDTTRLAASEARVWESILETNADTLRPLLEQLADDLEQIARQLDDPSALRRLFGIANLYRAELTGRTPLSSPSCLPSRLSVPASSNRFRACTSSTS
jgi:prephenate dehydrogenase